VETGGWIDQASGRVRFRNYVGNIWLPSRRVEVSMVAGYRSYLDKHLLRFFGDRPMAEILPAHVLDRVTAAVGSGLSPASVRKYHVMLHLVFKLAVRDRVIVTNPCETIELPKVPPREARILAPEEYDRLVEEVPDRFRVLVMTDIETGLRWGELIALRPRHIDLLRKTISVEQTIVEASHKHSPTGQRMIVRDYRRDAPRRQAQLSPQKHGFLSVIGLIMVLLLARAGVRRLLAPPTS
jgi:integrase